jgi:putative membrane protein
MSLRILALLLVAATPAVAHDASSLVSNEAVWTYDPWVVAPLYLSGCLYLIGMRRLWRRAGAGRGLRHWQVACFWAGWLGIALALISPLHWLGERLFTAHMIEHTVLMVIGAPLIAAARPMDAMLWALSKRLRISIGSLGAAAARSPLWRSVSHPLGATALHAVAIWAWHMPFFYDFVLTSLLAHRLQHLSFLITAVLFWWSLLHGRLRERGHGLAVLCLFVTMVHTALLGALLTLSRRLWYSQQNTFAEVFGLTRLEDQQLAGLVMWVPMGLIYTVAALAIAAHWIAHSGSYLRNKHNVVYAR